MQGGLYYKAGKIASLRQCETSNELLHAGKLWKLARTKTVTLNLFQTVSSIKNKP